MSTPSSDDVPTARGTAPPVSPRTAVHRSGVEHHRAGAARGDGVERRLVEHSAAGPRGGLQHRRPEGLGDHRARVGDSHAAQVGELPAGERDEVRVGEGQRNDAAVAGGRRQRVEPGAGDLGTGAGHRAGRPTHRVPLPHRRGRRDEIRIDGEAGGVPDG